ncbi:NifU-like N-terminal domain protein [uncultured Desulfobacterium sp.]|uniref:NifU-like N-terminal domain protein n=1 Tax=uncultured Desulfobacterium sp. TaxID=201089 RepID=A0A445MRJ0_9BACT|nr:NifU-like N-terminal domain protein [uncultured Desulfobacterium sp.]
MEKQQSNPETLTDDVYKMLSESGYSDKAIRYFQNKDKIGVLEDADQITDLTGPCGDTMKISLSIENGTIDDAKIQVLGCPGAVASGCALVSLARGKTLDEARGIDLDALYKELERMPEQKVHCARLAVKTLQKALDQYGHKGDLNGDKEKKG